MEQNRINRHVEENKYTYDETERVEDYLLQCDNNSLAREKLWHFIYLTTGSLELNLDSLLNIDVIEDIQFALSNLIDETHHIFM